MRSSNMLTECEPYKTL